MYKYCGKTWSENDLEQIRALISETPSGNRAELARRVCEIFAWRSPDGRPKLMSCRVAMIRMDRSGLIKLPTPMYTHRAPYKEFSSSKSDPAPSFETPITELNDLRVELVGRGAPLTLWNEYIARYHYLGYKTMPGAQLRYFIKSGDQVLGAMGFSAAAWKVAPRDSFIGWAPAQREAGLHLIVNQTRFLILPWVRCKNLATKSLALVSRRITTDWQERYGYRPVLMETFVDNAKFQGTCYKAGNWQMVGLTQGRTKFDRFHKNDHPVKSIWLMPLQRDFRRHLLGG